MTEQTTSAEYNSKGQFIGSKPVKRVDKPVHIEVESDEDRNDRNELANAAEWDRPSIAKRQAERRAAKAKPSPSPVESPVVLKPKQ